MFSHPIHGGIDGQKVTFNPESNVLVFDITTPFKSAGKFLGCKPEFGTPGIGINKGICYFVNDKKCKLLVDVLSAPGHKAYWINYDKLRSFIKNNNTQWKVSEKKYVHVIAWKIFSSKPNFSGVKQS